MRWRRSRSHVSLRSLCVSLNSVSFDRQDRRETYLVGQQNTLKNRVDLLSVVDEHAGDGRCAYQVAGAVVDIGEQADSAIAINRKRSVEGFVGKGTAHASILAPGSVADEVKADHTHSGYRCRASRQDQCSSGCE